jgi:tetratricopeptide (TPR) repeat protein
MNRLPPALLALLLVPLAAASAARQPIESEELPSAEGATPPPAVAAEPAAPAAGEAEAMQRYADGDLDGARAVYDRLAAQPGGAAAERARFALNASWLSWQVDDRAGALTRLEAALFLDPELDFRGELYAPEFVAGYHDALRVALHRRKVACSNAINSAVTAMRQGDLAAARELLGEALRMVPDDPDALYNLALVELRGGDESAALAGFERVLALERGNPEGVTAELKVQALNNAAVVYFGRQEYLDAETALDEAVRLVPGDAKAWFNLALTRQKLGLADAARQALVRARALAPDDVPTLRALALAEIERADWVAAVALLVEAVEREPADAELRLLLGRAKRGLGNLAGAADTLARAIDLDPQGRQGVAANAARLRAAVLRDQGDHAGSAAAARRLLELVPDDADGWMYVGLAELARNDVAAAVAALERARQAAPDRADIAHNLGSAYVAALDYQRAEAALAAALALDPDSADTRAALDRLAARAAAPPGSRQEIGARFSVGDYPDLGLRGLRVDAVAPGSPASRAGLRPGDLVLRAAGRAVADIAALLRLVGERRVTELAVLRGGQTLEMKLRLD